MNPEYPVPDPHQFGRRRSDYAFIAASTLAGCLLVLYVLVLVQYREQAELKVAYERELRTLQRLNGEFAQYLIQLRQQ